MPGRRSSLKPEPGLMTSTPGEPNAIPNHQAAPKASRQPETQDTVITTDTTEEIAPRAPQAGQLFAATDMQKLETFLNSRFPNAAIMTPNGPEKPVDTAIRLLEKFSTHADIRRCTEQFCNKPAGHRDEHGWVTGI